MSPTDPAYADVALLGTARVATDESFFLAEGPLWDPARERMLWVDIMDGAVHVARLEGDGSLVEEGEVRFPDTAGTVAVAADGAWVVAGTHRLHHRDAGGRVTSGPALIEGDERRFNDGKADPAGRLLVGTKGPGGELLLAVDRDGASRAIDTDLTLANGLGWSADGTRLYSVDTLAGVIFARDYDPESGETGTREMFARIEHGHPDGMTVDAEGHLWVAIWGGGCVLRLDPRGRIVGRVDVDAPHVSSVAFAGPALDVLVITTAREGLSEAELERYPFAGRLFTATTGVSGVAPYWWAGSDAATSTPLEGQS